VVKRLPLVQLQEQREQVQVRLEQVLLRELEQLL
jgi:hypothetical protein